MFSLLSFFSCLPKLPTSSPQEEIFVPPSIAEHSPQALIQDNYQGSKALIINIPIEKTTPLNSTGFILQEKLEQQGFEVVILEGESATFDNISSELTNLLTSNLDLHRKFVYIAGPTHQQKYIVPFDGQIQEQSVTEVESGDESSSNPWISEDTETSISKSILSIEQILNDFQNTQNLFLLIDADVDVENIQNKAFPSKLPSYDELQHYQMLFANTSPTTLINNKKEKGNCGDTTFFVCSLLTALEGTADYVVDGIITSDEISVYFEDLDHKIQHLGQGNIFFPNPQIQEVTVQPPSPYDVYSLLPEERAIKTLELFFELDELQEKNHFNQDIGEETDQIATQNVIDAHYRAVFQLVSNDEELQNTKPIQNFLLEYMDYLHKKSALVDLRTHQTSITASQIKKHEDGSQYQLITGDQSGMVIVWDLKNGAIINKYLFGREISVLEVHPQQNIAFVASKGGNAYLWNYQENTTKELVTSKGSIVTGTMMKDGERIYWISGNEMGDLVVWDEQGRKVGKASIGSNLMSLDADGGWIVVGNNLGEIHLLKIKEDQEEKIEKQGTLTTYYSEVQKLEILPGADRIISYSVQDENTKGKMQYWRLNRKKEKESFSIYHFTDFDVLAEKKRIAIANAKGKVIVTDFDGKKKFDFESDENGISDIKISNNGERILILSSDGKLHVHSGNSGRPKWDYRKHSVPDLPQDHATSFQLQYIDDYIVSIGLNNDVFVYSLQEKEYKTPLFHQDFYQSKSTSKTIVAATSQGAIYVWDAQGNPKPYILHGYESISNETLEEVQDSWRTTFYPKPTYIRDISISQDNKTLAIAFEDKRIRVWNLSRGKLKHFLEGHSNWPTDIEFSPNSEMLVSTDKDGNIILFGMNTGTSIYQWSSKDGIPTTSVAFSENNKTIAAGDEEGYFYLFDVISGEKIFEISSPLDAPITKIAFDHKNTQVFVGTKDGMITVFDIENLQILHSIQASSFPIEDIFVYPRNNQLLIKSSFDAQVYHIENNEIIETIDFNGRRITDIIPSEQGSKLLLTSGEDWIVKKLSPYSEKDPWTKIPIIAISGQIQTPKGSLEELDADFGNQFLYRMCLADSSIIKISDPYNLQNAFIPPHLATKYCK